MLRAVLTVISVVAVVVFGVLWFRGGQSAPAARELALASATSAPVQEPSTPALPSPTPVLPAPTATPTIAAPTTTDPHAGTGSGQPESDDSVPAPDETLAEVVEAVEAVEEPSAEVVEEPAEEVSEESIIAEPAEDESLAGGEQPVVAELPDGWESALVTLEGGVMGYVTSPSLNIRATPSVDGEIIDETYAWHTLTIWGAVSGDWVGQTNLWYVVGPEQYVTAAHVEPFTPAPPEETYGGAWVDVNLATGYAVAYLDDLPVYAAIVMWGKPGFETPLGVFEIYARVESETMDAATVGIDPDDPEYYYLPDVRWTQYFETGGFALHSNYWDAPSAFGGEASHGCINLLESDAAWFWHFLDIGSLVSIRM